MCKNAKKAQNSSTPNCLRLKNITVVDSTKLPPLSPSVYNVQLKTLSSNEVSWMEPSGFPLTAGITPANTCRPLGVGPAIYFFVEVGLCCVAFAGWFFGLPGLWPLWLWRTHLSYCGHRVLVDLAPLGTTEVPWELGLCWVVMMMMMMMTMLMLMMGSCCHVVDESMIDLSFFPKCNSGLSATHPNLPTQWLWRSSKGWMVSAGLCHGRCKGYMSCTFKDICDVLSTCVFSLLNYPLFAWTYIVVSQLFSFRDCRGALSSSSFTLIWPLKRDLYPFKRTLCHLT